jgi:SAM-dependent methyltransferase
MYSSNYDLKAFYNGRVGRVVRRIMQERIRAFWPDVHDERLLGCGYAVPYLRIFKGEASRICAMMDAGQGAHHWPHDDHNCVFLSEHGDLPIETNSIDRLLMIHDLEFAQDPQRNLEEAWRVLKSSGRLLIIAPNRSGLWAHTDWSPFGHGTPYSMSQLCHQLRENKFVFERSEEALFMPPVKFAPIIKSAGLFENIGRKYLPIVAGAHMVEASKQLYARVDGGKGARVKGARGTRVLMPKTVRTRDAKG